MVGGDAAAADHPALSIEEKEEMNSTSISSSTKPKTTSIGNIFLQIAEHPDGSITRPVVLNIPPTPTSSDHDTTVLSKDLPLNPNLNTSIRLFLPNTTNPNNTNINTNHPHLTQHNNRLPIIVYYHGGGFVLFSPEFALYHQFCHDMAAALPALVVSLDYRLSPEHKLPAAYDDAVDALMWVRHSTDPWILNHGDLSRCFVMGSSSGGNMAYFAGMRAAKLELDPVKLRGVVLIQPYFGGEKRTQSELDSEEDDILPLRANEMMWRMALPDGADRDHPYCNPMANKNNKKELELELELPFRTMVMGCRGDPLFDRQQAFVKMLATAGVDLVDRMHDEEKGAYHAIELVDPSSCPILVDNKSLSALAAAIEDVWRHRRPPHPNLDLSQ